MDYEIDLPKLQSIRLGYALMGSDDKRNSLIMKSSELIELIMRLAFIIISTRIWGCLLLHGCSEIGE